MSKYMTFITSIKGTCLQCGEAQADTKDPLELACNNGFTENVF
jgi:hypothetical protein